MKKGKKVLVVDWLQEGLWKLKKKIEELEIRLSCQEQFFGFPLTHLLIKEITMEAMFLARFRNKTDRIMSNESMWAEER